MSRAEDKKIAIESILKCEPTAKIIQQLADKNQRAGGRKTRIDLEVDAEFSVNEAWGVINERKKSLSAGA